MEMLKGGEREEIQDLGEVVRPLVWAVSIQGGGYVEVKVGCP